MRILHTSDLHLGISISNQPFIADQRYMVERIAGIARVEMADAVVIAGDIYDHAVTGAEAIALYDDLVTQLCLDYGLPVLACAGNHDGAARLSACSALLARAGLHIGGSVRDGIKTVAVGDCDFHILPYFSTDDAKYLYPDAGIAGQADAYRVLLDGIRARFQDGRKNILVSHCYVSGAEVSESDRAAVVGGASMVPASVFKGFDYVALGHLHKSQGIGGNVRYSGSPMKLSFAEAGMQKSVTLLDTDTMAVKEIHVPALRDMRVVKGTYGQALAIAENDDKRDDYIKIVLEDMYGHTELRQAFQQYYPNLLVFEGKAYADGSKLSSLRVEEASSLSPEEIMRRFYTEYTEGAEPSAKQLQWFQAALQAADREGGALQ